MTWGEGGKKKNLPARPGGQLIQKGGNEGLAGIFFQSRVLKKRVNLMTWEGKERNEKRKKVVHSSA